MQTPTITEAPATRAGSRFLRIAEVSWRTGLRKTAIYDWIKAKRFPEPIRLSARAVVWLEADIERWIEERAATAKAAA